MVKIPLIGGGTVRSGIAETVRASGGLVPLIVLRNLRLSAPKWTVEPELLGSIGHGKILLPADRDIP